MNSSASASHGRRGQRRSALHYRNTESAQESCHSDGSKRKPGLSCMELRDCHPDFKDGLYWIDPNGGCTADALLVFCNFTAGGSTCIIPELDMKSSSLMTQWQYQYRIDSIQLRFLKLLNNKAYQALSLSCCGFEDMENESLSTANTNTVIQCWNGSKIRYPRVNCATHQDTSPSGNDPEACFFHYAIEDMSCLPLTVVSTPSPCHCEHTLSSTVTVEKACFS